MSQQTKTAAEASRDIAKERLIERGAVGARAEHANGQQSCGYFEGGGRRMPYAEARSYTE